jgi:adenine deaminase
MSFSVAGNLVDIRNKRIYPAEILIEYEKIVSIKEQPGPSPTFPKERPSAAQGQLSEEQKNIPSSGSEQWGSPLIGESAGPVGRLEGPGPFILSGFIDAHVHIESSMLIPSEFARLAVVHGTVATVSDPHEIANVCGMKGVEFMIENGRTVPFKFYFGAPSCVPATTFETAGAVLDANDVNELMMRDEILYLSEMMNFPGVLNGDEEVMKKIASAKKYNKPIDGHAPGLSGEEAKKYIEAGISTDHECFTKEEALDKLKYGMKIIIREGSAAKNFEALIDLLNDYPDMIMFCSDDKHPDSLVEGHINQLCARAVAKGIDVFKVLQAACVNPVHHYKLDVGLLREGDPADLIVVKDLENFEVLQTYVDGELVAEEGKSLISNSKSAIGNHVNNFNCSVKQVEEFQMIASNSPLGAGGIVIEALDGQLITNKLHAQPKIENGKWISDVDNDILKIVVVNRYSDAPVAKAFIKNFGLKRGAIASSVAHDSHNIVAVGADDESICAAVNLVIESKGGVAAHPGPACPAGRLPEGKETLAQPSLKEAAFVNNESSISEVSAAGGLSLREGSGMDCAVLPLPIAGLMSIDDGYLVAKKYSEIDRAAKDLGSTLSSPFMTLSFMALLVIPHLKLSDKGLFDGDEFRFV